METTNHDNINVKVNSRITFYGPVVAIGSIPLLGIAIAFLLIWMTTHWTAAIALSQWLVYGFFGLLGATLCILVLALATKIVIHPLIDARERAAQVAGQELKNQVVWAQENAIVAVVEGSLQVVPLFPQRMLSAPKEEKELPMDDETIIEMYNDGQNLQSLVETTGWKYNKIQRIVADAKKRGEITN